MADSGLDVEDGYAGLARLGEARAAEEFERKGIGLRMFGAD